VKPPPFKKPRASTSLNTTSNFDDQNLNTKDQKETIIKHKTPNI